MGRPKKTLPKHSSGMYEYKATVGHTFDGKPIRKSFYSKTSKESAKAKANEYIINTRIAEQTGEAFIAKESTFSSWAIKWLETYKKGNVKPHTYKWTYETNVTNHFIPYFNNAKLCDIKQIDIQAYFNTKTDLAITTLQKQKMILYSIFDAAIDNDMCYKNPVKSIKLTSQKAEYKKRWYTKAQSEKLIAYCLKENTKYSKAVYLLLSLGLRKGELLGLKWCDIDFENKVVNVKRAVEPDTKGEPKDGELKSKSAMRQIPFDYDDILADFLSTNVSNGYVIAGNANGYTPIPTFDTCYKEFMSKATTILGIPYMTPHELRHTYGSVLREKGLDLYSISKLMGHSDSQITEKHYIGNDIAVLRQRLKAL